MRAEAHWSFVLERQMTSSQVHFLDFDIESADDVIFFLFSMPSTVFLVPSSTSTSPSLPPLPSAMDNSNLPVPIPLPLDPPPAIPSNPYAFPLPSTPPGRSGGNIWLFITGSISHAFVLVLHRTAHESSYVLKAFFQTSFPVGSASVVSVRVDSGVSHRLVMIDIESHGLSPCSARSYGMSESLQIEHSHKQLRSLFV